MNDIFTEWFNESAENQQLTAQERLIIEVTEAIYSKMDDVGITKADLAQKLGKSQAFVSQLLSGSRNMTLRTLSDLCFAVGGTPSITIRDGHNNHWENWDGIVYTNKPTVNRPMMFSGVTNNYGEIVRAA